MSHRSRSHNVTRVVSLYSPSRLVRLVQAAMWRASTTREAIIDRLAFQPTSHREKTSMMKAT